MRPAALCAVVSALVLAACATETEPVTILCDDFKVGSDMSRATFGVTPPLDRSYASLAQATSDVSIAAASLSARLDGACRRLVTGLGLAQPVEAPCALAAQALRERRSQLAAAHLDVRVAPPRCPIAAELLSACEVRCQVDVSCTSAALATRCAPADVQGRCSGACLGACEGSEGAAIACAGRCAGVCTGSCTTKGVSSARDGAACDGRCEGTCTAACASDAPSACEGVCRGGCAGEYSGISCDGPVAAPSCAGDSDCLASCLASASARSACSSGWLEVRVDDAARRDPTLATLIFALEESLPVVFLAARGRGKALADGASGLIDAAGHVLSQRDALGAKGAACGITIGVTAVQASDNLRAVLAEAKAVVSALE
jgi:hypothetical protein